MAQAAIRIAARDAGLAGLVSVSAASLTEGVLNTMYFVKLKTAAAVVLAAGTLAFGAAVWGYQEAAPRAEVRHQSSAAGENSPSTGAASQATADADYQDVSEFYIAKLEQALRALGAANRIRS